jgi:hypothetical protein
VLHPLALEALSSRIQFFFQPPRDHPKSPLRPKRVWRNPKSPDSKRPLFLFYRKHHEQPRQLPARRQPTLQLLTS